MMGQGVGEEWREGGGGVLLMEFVVEDIIVENMNFLYHSFKYLEKKNELQCHKKGQVQYDIIKFDF